MAFGDVQIYQQRGHRLGSHAGAAIGVQREHAGLDVVAGHRIGDELFGQLGTFALGDRFCRSKPEVVAWADEI